MKDKPDFILELQKLASENEIFKTTNGRFPSFGHNIFFSCISYLFVGLVETGMDIWINDRNIIKELL